MAPRVLQEARLDPAAPLAGVAQPARAIPLAGVARPARVIPLAGVARLVLALRPARPQPPEPARVPAPARRRAAPSPRGAR
ncbi:MAG TPA: hypothetical protein VMR00_24030 [Streptosporangiaceae bacterium]|nr:hypothetical protein [Streptosporangiaceae bacterium]